MTTILPQYHLLLVSIEEMSFELNKKGYENTVFPIFKNILEISPMYYSPLCQWRL